MIHHIQATWSKFQLSEHHACTNRHLLAGILETQVSTHKGIGHLLHHLMTEVDIDIADIPLALNLRSDAISHHQAQVHLARNIHRIGKIRGIAILVIIKSIVAEKTGEALTLQLQLGDIEGTALLDECRFASGINQLLAIDRKVEITH